MQQRDLIQSWVLSQPASWLLRKADGSYTFTKISKNHHASGRRMGMVIPVGVQCRSATAKGTGRTHEKKLEAEHGRDKTEKDKTSQVVPWCLVEGMKTGTSLRRSPGRLR